jgi:hypothetical protein
MYHVDEEREMVIDETNAVVGSHHALNAVVGSHHALNVEVVIRRDESEVVVVVAVMHHAVEKEFDLL